MKTALFTNLNDHICFFLTDGKILHFADFDIPENKMSKDDGAQGSIWLGTVKNVAANLSAAFVEYKPGVFGFLPLSKKALNTVKGGDKFPVLIEKSAVKTKDASLSRKLSLAGLYVVVTADPGTVRYSSRLSEEKINAFKEVFEKNPISKDYTVIVRSFAGTIDPSNADDKAIILSEIKELSDKIEEIVRMSEKRTDHTCLYSGEDFVKRCLTLIDSDDTEKIVCDDPKTFESITALLPRLMREKCSYYSDDYPATALYDIKKQLSETLSKRIWLKSGGYLVVEHTEAMTVIDVNTGKNESRIKKDELIKKTNDEAIERIAPLIRAGGFSGMVIVDLIGNAYPENEKIRLVEKMRDLTADDHDKVRVIDITPLGLMEITRMKRQKQLSIRIKEAGLNEILTDE